ncbi:MAG: hypothetical protein H6738_02235 [Alphaproteobacteria bacterium]|nr:hypothetical protein [Alphaproteobacteria bacterium]MCB9695588.1 hypothetical protein [Alphaproteobacteria bacterium]
MSPSTLFLIGLGVVLGTNHLLVRSELARRIPALFFLVVGMDVLVALAVLLVGVPGVPGIGRLLVALVLMLHLAQNFRLRLGWTTEDREAELQTELKEARRLQEEEHALHEARRQQADASAPTEG